MRVLITASGGGHTGYALSLGLRLKGSVDLVFVTRRGDWLSKARIRRVIGDGVSIIETFGARGPFDQAYTLAPGLSRGFLDSLQLARLGVDVAVCMGHNHSVPPCLVAWLSGSRLVSLEAVDRFFTKGRAVRALSRVSDFVALHWTEQKRLYNNGLVVGPVYEDPMYEPWDGGYILVTGGTYGHKPLFDSILKAGIGDVVLQAGSRLYREYSSVKGWRVIRYTVDLHRLIAGARVVVTHQGVTAATAALAYGKPVVIVYNPEFRLAASPLDALALGRKLGAPVVLNPRPETVVRALDNARPPRRISGNGAELLAKAIMSLTRQ
ncbi:MAG: polysaccharide biosynthesis protein [Desulfurococcales archaeon]|nr:polysaccharide biosynthesis protein [Desulfurococcales archaeon]